MHAPRCGISQTEENDVPPSFNVKPTDRPSREDETYYLEEAGFFDFRPANPNAPQDSPDSRGWGIPKHKLPPPDAMAYLLAHYMEDQLGLRVHDKTRPDYTAIHPQYKWSFVCACMAHFLWFRTNNGAAWINRFYGVQERPAFREGYVYFWIDPKLNSASMLKEPVYRRDARDSSRQQLADGVELRIFREWERSSSPPCSVQNAAPLEEMKKLLARYRNPYANRDTALPPDKAFFWASEVLRDWFLEAAPDRDWPTRKGTRICGWQWVKALEKAPGVPFFEALSKVSLYKGRAYRLQDATGGVYWCSGKEIKIVPRNDLYLQQNAMTDAQVDGMFRCHNCRTRRPCVPYTGDAHRCCSCYGVELERDDRPTLNQCTMDRECKACPKLIKSNSDLVMLKNRLSAPIKTGPVPR
jgi:hypothetical protein